MRVYLAGAEQKYFTEVISLTGHKFALLSYYYFKKHKEELRRKIVDCLNQNHMYPVMDSGLFTMMFGAGKGQKYDLAQMTEYTKKYLSDIKSYGIKNVAVVECDVHKIVGMPAVFELRKHFQGSGIQTIYVWHREEGLEGLTKLSSEESYIALSVPELRILFSAQSTRYQAAVFNLLAKLKRELGSKVLPRIHLLGNTVKETMETPLAYSCDSTSYKSAIRYGNAIVFDNGALKKMHIRSASFVKLVAQTMEENPLACTEIEKMSANQSMLKTSFVCALSYYHYQRWLDQRYTWEGRQ